MTSDSVNEAILSIWQSHTKERDGFNKLTKLVPMLYPELETDAILFIGLNPSFSYKAFNSFLKNKILYKDVLNNPEEFYTFKSSKETDIAKYLAIEDVAINSYAYFDRFKDIAEDNSCTWVHIDLLFIRNTTQKDVQALIKDQTKFITDQLNLSFKLIKALQPKVIVAANAFASKLLLYTSSKFINNSLSKDFSSLKPTSQLDIEWNDDLGTYLLDSKTPLFLSGMLTGQRALDKGSFERLKWHIRSALKN